MTDHLIGVEDQHLTLLWGKPDFQSRPGKASAVAWISSCRTQTGLTENAWFVFQHLRTARLFT